MHCWLTQTTAKMVAVGEVGNPKKYIKPALNIFCALSCWLKLSNGKYESGGALKQGLSKYILS
jgi:hypothetical protein